MWSSFGITHRGADHPIETVDGLGQLREAQVLYEGGHGDDQYATSEQASEIDDGYLPPDYPFDFEDRDNLIDPVI